MNSGDDVGAQPNAAVRRAIEDMDARERAQDEHDAEATAKAAESAMARHRGTPRRQAADC